MTCGIAVGAGVTLLLMWTSVSLELEDEEELDPPVATTFWLTF